MNMILDCFTRKYATFSGRASRKEYWLFTLTYAVLVTLAFIVDILIGEDIIKDAYLYFRDTFILISALPMLAVSIRRLHDINRSGWWFLIGLIPIAGTIWIAVLYCLKGTQGQNRYDVDTPNMVKQVA